MVGLGALVNLAHQAAVRPGAAHRVAVPLVDRGEDVGVGLEAAERVVQVDVGVALGEPPAARHEHDARIDLGLDVRAHLDAAALGLDPAPVAVLDVKLLSELGVDRVVRIRVQVAHTLHLEVFRVVVRHEAAARGEHDRVLFGEFRIVDVVLSAGQVGRHTRIAQLAQDRGVALDLAGRRPEATARDVLVLVQRRIVHADVVDEVVPVGAGKTQRSDDVGVDFLFRLPRPVRGILTAGQAEHAPEGHVGVTVELRLDSAAAAHDGVGRAVVRDNRRTLESAGGREHVVGEERCRGHPVIDGDQELNLLQGGERHLGVAVGVHRVGRVADESANLVRLAGEDRLEHARAVSLAEPLCGKRLAPGALGIVGDERVAGPRGQLELVRADLLRLLLLGKQLVELELFVGDEVEGRAGHAVAAGNLEVAGDGAHELTGLRAGRGRRSELVPRAAPLDAAGLGGRVHASSLADVLRVEPGDGGSPFRRVRSHVLTQLLEAVAPLVDEVEVVEELVDDDVEHRERERGVRARSQRQPQVCLAGGFGETRVDVDDLHARKLKVSVAVHGGQRRCSRVHAPKDQALRSAQVGLERRPAGDDRLGHKRRDPAQKCVVETVRRAELVQEATTRPVIGAGRAASGGNRLSARLGLDLVESLGDLFDRLIVRDLLPLVLALLASALERVVDAGGMVDVQKRARSAAAQTTLVVVIGIAFDLDYVAVLDIGKDTAVGMAEIALRSDALDAFGEFAVLVVNADLISHLPSPLLLVLQTPTIRFVGFLRPAHCPKAHGTPRRVDGGSVRKSPPASIAPPV